MGNATLHQLFEAQVEKTPDAPALIFAKQVLTYAELNQRANQVAHVLQSMGMAGAILSAICIERSPALVIGILGILKTGAAYVPLDPDYPPNGLALWLEDAGIPLALTEKKLAAAVWMHCDLSMVLLDSDWQQIATQADANLHVERSDHEPLYLIYTSGSTGLPKGVVVPHRGVANTILAIASATELSSGDRFLQFVPFSFDASALEFFSTLCSGATLVLHANPTRLSSLELLRLCVEEQISVVNFTVALWHQWVDDLSQQGLRFPAGLRVSF